MTNAENSKLSPIGELRQLEDLVAQVVESLTTQKEILKRRGMNLPPLVVETLSSVKRDLGDLENGLVEEQTELSQLRALADMSAKITTSLDVDTVLQETMEIVIALTQAERGYIILKNLDTDEFEFRVSNESGVFGSGASKQTGERPQISMTVVNEVISTGEALLADNAFKDERLQGNVSIANFALRSVLCVPLNYKGETTGVVYVDNRLQAGLFTQREKNLMIAFANTAAVAIANARMYTRTQYILAEITRVKELMDNVFSSIGSGIIATDAENVIRTFNRAASEILARPIESAIGESAIAVLQSASVQLSDQLTAVRERDERQTLETELEPLNGGRIAVNLTMTPLKDANDVTQGVTMVLDDITAQRDQEQIITMMKTYLPPEMVDNIHDIANLALGGERREVTCLFADVRPLVTLTDVPPSEKLNIINQYQAVATDCIHNVGGIIDKYMGNEVMALFNTQLNPQENHAQKALECALLMRDEFLKLYDRLGINPEPHYYIIGMNTGDATLGNVGSFNRREFTAIGDTINSAKRIEENAVRGSITVPQSTYDHVLAYNDGSSPYEFREREPIQAKGKTLKLRAYEVFRSG